MERNEQLSGGVFLIGLAMLFMTGYWWPGILFVIGAAALAKGLNSDEPGERWGGLGMIGLGVVFAFGFRWELLLIFAGVSMLVGHQWHNWTCDDKGKRKNIGKRKNDEEFVEIEMI